jgi:hypothetical protein
MAKKPKINKSQAVRDYLAGHPEAMPKEVMEALAKDGIKVSRVHVSTVKSKFKKASPKAKRAATVAATPAAPTAVEKPTTNGGTITLEQVKKIAHTIKTLGGHQRVTEVLEVIKEMGGVKKFRDLAEAMSVTETDGIPV